LKRKKKEKQRRRRKKEEEEQEEQQTQQSKAEHLTPRLASASSSQMSVASRELFRRED
jgi:hypothetical protein